LQIVGIEAGIHARESQHRMHHQPGSSQKDHRDRDLRHHEPAAQHHHRARRATSGSDDEGLSADARRFERGHDAEHERAGTAENGRPAEHQEVQTDLVETGHVVRRHADEAGEDGRTGQRAEDATGDDKERLFDQELPDQGPPAASDGRADAELVGARRAPVQEQTRKIEAGDEEQQRDGARQHAEHGRHVVDDPVGERDEQHPALAAVFAVDGGRDALHLRPGRRNADVRFQPADRVQCRARVAALHSAIVRRHLRLEQEVHVRRSHVFEAWRQHADHRERVAVERDRLADRRRVTAELAHPERMTDDDRGGGARASVGFIEQPPTQGRDAEHAEEFRRNAPGLEPAWDGPARDDDRVSERTGEVVERSRATLPVFEVRPHDAEAILLRQKDQPLGAGIRQRPSQHGIGDGVDRRRRANPEDEQDQRRRREPRRPP
jgi:hypothetical protein